MHLKESSCQLCDYFLWNIIETKGFFKRWKQEWANRYQGYIDRREAVMSIRDSFGIQRLKKVASEKMGEKSLIAINTL